MPVETLGRMSYKHVCLHWFAPSMHIKTFDLRPQPNTTRRRKTGRSFSLWRRFGQRITGNRYGNYTLACCSRISGRSRVLLRPLSRGLTFRLSRNSSASAKVWTTPELLRLSSPTKTTLICPPQMGNRNLERLSASRKAAKPTNQIHAIQPHQRIKQERLVAPRKLVVLTRGGKGLYARSPRSPPHRSFSSLGLQS